MPISQLLRYLSMRGFQLWTPGLEANILIVRRICRGPRAAVHRRMLLVCMVVREPLQGIIPNLYHAFFGMFSFSERLCVMLCDLLSKVKFSEAYSPYILVIAVLSSISVCIYSSTYTFMRTCTLHVGAPPCVVIYEHALVLHQYWWDFTHACLLANVLVRRTIITIPSDLWPTLQLLHSCADTHNVEAQHVFAINHEHAYIHYAIFSI
jgi:hypothetical protein